MSKLFSNSFKVLKKPYLADKIRNQIIAQNEFYEETLNKQLTDIQTAILMDFDYAEIGRQIAEIEPIMPLANPSAQVFYLDYHFGNNV